MRSILYEDSSNIRHDNPTQVGVRAPLPRSRFYTVPFQNHLTWYSHSSLSLVSRITGCRTGLPRLETNDYLRLIVIVVLEHIYITTQAGGLLSSISNHELWLDLRRKFMHDVVIAKARFASFPTTARPIDIIDSTICHARAALHQRLTFPSAFLKTRG
jgi:hypothetical protein